MDSELPPEKPGCLRWSIIGVAGVVVLLGILIIGGYLFYTIRYGAESDQPISEPFSLPTPIPASESSSTQVPGQLTSATRAPIFILPTPIPDVKPVCGDDAEWLVLIVGVDYRGEGYLYGLADAIRIARVDFVDMTVDMVSLPRDLIVEVPEGRFTVPGPFKINQSYLFGTPGMAHYSGSGQGAGALAEVIQHNFGITVDHYGVVNFETFANFINTIGGVEVDLPMALSDEKYGSFPAGKQTLSGERALSLIRIRKNYGDAFRVNNQTMVLRSILGKLLNPAVIIKVPGMLNEFAGSFLTDLSIDQLSSLGVCFLRNFKGDNLHTYQAPMELLVGENAFIPTLNDNAFVYRWDQKFVQWVYQSLMGE